VFCRSNLTFLDWAQMGRQEMRVESMWENRLKIGYLVPQQVYGRILLIQILPKQLLQLEGIF